MYAYLHQEDLQGSESENWLQDKVFFLLSLSSFSSLSLFFLPFSLSFPPPFTFFLSLKAAKKSRTNVNAAQGGPPAIRIARPPA